MGKMTKEEKKRAKMIQDIEERKQRIFKEAVAADIRRKKEMERKQQRQNTIDALSAKIISDKQKQGMSYKEIRLDALDMISKVNMAQEAGKTTNNIDIIIDSLNQVVYVAERKENYHISGEFPPVEPAKTLRLK